MKILILDPAAAGLNIALRFQWSGHDVKTFIPRVAEGEMCFDIGEGMIHKVEAWQPHMDWAELILVTGNDKYATELEPFFKRGYPIVGTNRASAALELNRAMGQTVLEECGIETLDFAEFTSYDKAIEFLKHERKAYVSKPWGGAIDKSLSYVPPGDTEAECRANLICRLERWKQEGLKGQFILQEKIDGTEMAAGTWFGPGGFSRWINETWEEKRLMNDGYGPMTGEMGCYDAATEVLTETGWKFWPHVTAFDRIATLAAEELVFTNMTELVSYDYIGPMVRWVNQTLDICVTPNHNMYVQRQCNARRGRDAYEFIPAEHCTQSQYEVLRTAKWRGVSSEYHKVPSYTHNQGNGSVTEPYINVPAVMWARFVGFYIGDGSSDGKTVHLAQSHPVKVAILEDFVLDGLPFKPILSNNGFRIHNAQLASYLKPLGRSYEKRVPQYIKDADSTVITAFLEGYCLADGNEQVNGFRIFYTSSKLLADDVQELLCKIGHVGIITVRNRVNQVNIAPDGHEIVSRREAYEVCERVKKTRSWLDQRDRKLTMYTGKVYCATVPSHVMFVRRNGKPVWCGNTVLRYTKQSKLFEEVVRPLEGALHELGFVGNVDVSCMIDKSGVPWPMEFTMRFGWPAFNLMLSLHKGDPAEWLFALLEGRDVLECSRDLCCGVLMSLGDYPWGNWQHDRVANWPIRGLSAEVMKNVALTSVKMGRAPTALGNRIEDRDCLVTAGEYVLVAMGQGDSVEAARKAAYGIAEQIHWPPHTNLRTDIGCRLEKGLKELHRHGYATDVRYGAE